MNTTELEVHGSDAMWQVIDRLEDHGIEVMAHRSASHACNALSSFEAASVALRGWNIDLLDECGDCAREAALDARVDALIAA